jgi:hypothetical protein
MACNGWRISWLVADRNFAGGGGDFRPVARGGQIARAFGDQAFEPVGGLHPFVMSVCVPAIRTAFPVASRRADPLDESSATRPSCVSDGIGHDSRPPCQR